MEKCTAKTEGFSLGDWAISLFPAALAYFQAVRVRKPSRGVVLGGNAEELARRLRAEIGGKWDVMCDGETRPWVLLHAGLRRLKRHDVIVVQAKEEPGKEPLWTCSGLAEIFRQPEGRAFVIGIVEVETAAVKKWVKNGAWGLLDAASVHEGPRGIGETVSAVRESLRGI